MASECCGLETSMRVKPQPKRPNKWKDRILRHLMRVLETLACIWIGRIADHLTKWSHSGCKSLNTHTPSHKVYITSFFVCTLNVI
jgi:hypothetical protein